MNTMIALLRGINVGGHNKLPMRELVGILAGLGLRNIETYIQSGNVVFEFEGGSKLELSNQIRDAIHQSHGFLPDVVLLTAEELEKAILANPFPEAEDQSKTLHLYFLGSEPQHPDMQKIDEIKSGSERYALAGKVFYLHAPDGIGRSKLAAGVENALGVPVTARNWRSVKKISEMAKR
jgi:uncharacterized protein (DUF1697 family)